MMTGNEVTPGAFRECPLRTNISALVTVAMGFAPNAEIDKTPETSAAL
jgi:hypothetical protein